MEQLVLSGRLRIHLHCAKNLTASSMSGNADPYCKFKLHETRAHSKAKLKTLNPVWDERCSLPCPHPLSLTTPLVVKVRDQSRFFRDGRLGEAHIKPDELSSLAKGESVSFNLQLNPQGSVELELSWTPASVCIEMQLEFVAFLLAVQHTELLDTAQQRLTQLMHTILSADNKDETNSSELHSQVQQSLEADIKAGGAVLVIGGGSASTSDLVDDPEADIDDDVAYGLNYEPAGSSPNSGSSFFSTPPMNFSLGSSASPEIVSPVVAQISQGEGSQLPASNTDNAATVGAEMQSMVLTMASEVEMACTLDSLYHQLSSFAKSFAYWAGFNGTHSVSEVLGAVTEMMGAEREHQIRTSHVNFASKLERNSTVMLLALCKLCEEPISVDATQNPTLKPMQVFRASCLDMVFQLLQLINGTLNNSSWLLLTVRRYLCGTLLIGNTITSNPQLYNQSLKVFALIYKQMRFGLRQEVEMLLAVLFLRVFERSGCDYTEEKHRLALRALLNIWQQPQMIIDIFLNYDCDPSYMHLLERCVNDLAHTAEARPKNSVERELQMLSIRNIVNVLHGLSHWRSTQGSQPPIPEVVVNPDTGSETQILMMEGSYRDNAIQSLEAQQHDLKMQQRKVLAKAMTICNTASCNKGLTYLTEQGYLRATENDYAQFLFGHAGLDKVKIGEYIGKDDDMATRTRRSFCRLVPMKNLTFDEGLREFLSHFWLPGEAQQIDRIMESFAEAYCKQNVGVFCSVDTAYVLAFSLIMLNTDAHSSNIKKKMTMEEFVRNNRGINGDNDLPEQYMKKLYNGIVTNEIQMKVGGGTGSTRATSSLDSAVANSRKRQMLGIMFDARSAEDTSRRLQQLQLDTVYCNTNNQYQQANQMELVPRILESIWHAVLGALSTALERSNEAELVTIAMAGFKHGIRVCDRFGLSLEHDALVNAVERFKCKEAGL